ncbi:MAG TPA: SRPBCC domain-containing protein [Rhodanobacteraceae bacterium]|nr:SRPBCC domain-containing protein [Rhodanobacteraceae bacterium]
MAEIMHLLKIDAPRESVYRAIASVEGVRNWLSRDADFDSMMGNSGEIRFAGGTRILKILLEELKPTTRVAWNVLSAAMPNWAGTTVEFEMDADGGDTMLHFKHQGFQQADDLFAMSATIWASFLISLKQYLETGHGTPHPDDPLSRQAGRK